MTDYDKHEIRYTSKWTGKTTTKTHVGSDASAREWTKGLSDDNKCKAVCESVSRDGSKRHVVSEGSD